MRTEILGSPSALSIAAATNPAVLPIVAFVGGVAVLGAVAQFVFQKLQNYQKEKHDAIIRRIIGAWDETLSHIPVAGYVENIGLPPIFQFNNEDESYETMHFTDAQVKAMAANALNNPDDPIIVKYKGNIIAAIKTLKDYYLIHSDKTSLSVVVIQYLLDILESKSLHFQGYTFDIALLNAMIRFNYTFASFEGEDALRVEFLTKVNRSLKRAKRELEKHQKFRTQPEIVNALLGTCRSSSDQLIRMLVKIITPHQYWTNVDNQMLDELQKGVVVSRIKKRIVGHISHETDTVKMPNTFIMNWLHEMITYYLQTMDPDFQAVRIPPLSVFSIPTQLVKEHKKLWRSVFNDSENFVTRELDPINEKYIPIREPGKIIARLSFVAEIAKLLHLCCSFQFMLTGLSKFIKLFGQYQVDNPAHCINLYHLLDKLSHEVVKQIDHVQIEFEKIESSNNDTMRMVFQEEFCNDFESQLKLMRISIIKNSAAIRNCRRNFMSAESHQTPQAAEQALLTHVSQIMHIYGIAMPSINMSSGELAVVNTQHVPRAEDRNLTVIGGESDTESESPQTTDGSVQAEAPIILPAPQEQPASAITQPRVAITTIQKLYESNARFFNASNTIFKSGTESDAVIALMRTRAENHPGGASEKTLVDLGLMKDPLERGAATR